MQILLPFFLVTVSTLAILHNAALTFFLYWRYSWFDIPMHVLGGICVAFGVAVIPFSLSRLRSFPVTLMSSVLMAGFIGIAWELFEVFAGISIMDEDFVLDTTIDLCMDLVGGALGYSIVRSIKSL